MVGKTRPYILVQMIYAPYKKNQQTHCLLVLVGREIVANTVTKLGLQSLLLYL